MLTDLLSFSNVNKYTMETRSKTNVFALNNILFQFVKTFTFKYINRIQRHNHTGFENKHIMLLWIISCNKVTLWMEYV